MYINAIKSGKKQIPNPPDWMLDYLIAKSFNRFPWELEEAPLEWVARLYEMQYQTTKQAINL